MSRDQLAQIGAVLASYVDMVKGFLGDQFAVSIIARHKSGPFHLLIGDDAELALIQTLSELQRMGTALIKDGNTVVEAEPSAADHMVAMLQECAEQFADYARLHKAKERPVVTAADAEWNEVVAAKAAANQDLSDRCYAVLDMVAPERAQTPQPEDGLLIEVQSAPFPPPDDDE
jgi:hypothetical protein